MKKIFGILLLFIPLLGNAQQDALYSQYMFNPFAINPAYAGSRDALSAVLLHRAQWVGMDGAPNTTSLAMHSKLKGRKVALGVNLFADRLGPSLNSGIFGTYAYHLPLAKGHLSMALRAGLYGSALDRNKLDYYQTGDVHDAGGSATAIMPSFDAGVYYYTTKFFAGISATHLAGSQAEFNNNSNILITLRQHFIATTGMALPMGKQVVFRPSVLVRYVHGAPVNLDINASFLFNKSLWLGVSYRSSNSLTLLTEYNILQYLRIGYSYDLLFSRLKSYSAGSHELFLGVDLNIKKDKVTSPRYL
jgi:type IX secretion system PorP/SprF family membrane protein